MTQFNTKGDNMIEFLIGLIMGATFGLVIFGCLKASSDEEAQMESYSMRVDNSKKG